jgi:uncharacterized membrane protein YqjE
MRHIGAYIDLVALDLARAQREITAQVVATIIVAICFLFALFLVCMGVIAYTWNTPYRIDAIAWMTGIFIIIAIACLIYRARIARARSPLFAYIHREWHEDKVILERILSSDEESR